MPVGKPKRVWSLCCVAELIIVPAYPVSDRRVLCSACGKENVNDHKYSHANLFDAGTYWKKNSK